MVRIRLRRVGAKKQPSYRIIAADKESPRDGRFLEILGFYNPRTEPATIQLKEDRIYEWLGKGAQPSESVAKVFKVAGLIQRYDRLKAGEAMETLLAEAAAAETARNIDPRTRRETPAKKAKKTETG
jgi:small subunit ribosomal protein S16